jgi:hypothetical protein
MEMVATARCPLLLPAMGVVGSPTHIGWEMGAGPHHHRRPQEREAGEGEGRDRRERKEEGTHPRCHGEAREEALPELLGRRLRGRMGSGRTPDRDLEQDGRRCCE